MICASCSGTRRIDSGWRRYVEPELYSQAAQHRAAGRNEEARRALRTLRLEDPRNLAAFLGEIEVTENDDDRAALATDLDGLVAATDNVRLRASYLALLSQLETDELRREDSLRAALNIDPENALVHSMLGRLLEERADPRSAAVHWDAAADGKEPPPFALRSIANSMVGAHSRRDAIASLEAYMTIVPGDAAVAFNLGTLYLKEDRPDRAYDWLLRAHEADERDVDVLLNLSSAAILSGRLDKAEELLENARRLNPQDPEIVFNLAVLYADHLDRPADAIQAFREYVELGGADVRRVDRWVAELQEDLR